MNVPRESGRGGLAAATEKGTRVSGGPTWERKASSTGAEGLLCLLLSFALNGGDEHGRLGRSKRTLSTRSQARTIELLPKGGKFNFDICRAELLLESSDKSGIERNHSRSKA